tara:strand:- start:583 stop:693 length:111 start_codon:yes stop_codon:yes gene_type:complete
MIFLYLRRPEEEVLEKPSNLGAIKMTLLTGDHYENN